MTVLSGVKIIEIEGIGPAPFCGMHLADLGADVVLVERPGPPGFGDLGDKTITKRGKRIIKLNLKDEEDKAKLLDLVAHADGLIEGMRPGVMERLGLGPDICHKINPKLAYGRVTGWGQDGPLAHAAGHDINYNALSGALWYSGRPGDPPFATPTRRHSGRSSLSNHRHAGRHHERLENRPGRRGRCGHGRWFSSYDEFNFIAKGRWWSQHGARQKRARRPALVRHL